MILIISHPNDEHVQVVLRELSGLGASAALLDLSRFPCEMGLVVRYAGASREMRVRTADGEIALDRCGAVWWRRPQPFTLHPEIDRPAHRAFALSESYEALMGVWYSHPVFWVNQPARDEVAHRKVHQLRVAQRVGLPIPRTLVTNCVDEARAFVGGLGEGRTIYKAFTGTEQDWRETRLLKRDEVSLLDCVRFAPVIFQEYVEADVDVRITIVGQQMFAAAIHSQDTSYPVDFRMDMANARIEAHSLPGEVAEKLASLMRRLGLEYGAVDMRRTPDGEYVFLEINPAGQWLFVETRTGQPISRALATLLAIKDRRPLPLRLKRTSRKTGGGLRA